jgi:hypothetical protein
VKSIFGTAAFAVMAILTLTSTLAADCKNNCLIKIEGLQSSYAVGSSVNVVIRNRSSHNTDVNVALEALEGDAWREVSASVSDPQNALAKTLRLKPIKAGSSLGLTFDICQTPILVKVNGALSLSEHSCTKPIAGAIIPSSFRLRVDVHVKGRREMAQRVRSAMFSLNVRGPG